MPAERRQTGGTDSRVLDIIEKQHDFQAVMLNKMQETQSMLAQVQAVHANVLKNVADWQITHEREQREDRNRTEEALDKVETAIIEQSASNRTLARVIAIAVPILVAAVELVARVWPKVP